MKYQFALYVLAVAFVSLQAAPLRQLWYDLAPAAGEIRRGGLGDIWSTCNHSGDPLIINNVSVNPDPPKKGSTLTIDANITLKETVTGGNLHFHLKWGIITVDDKNLDLCDALQKEGQSCPLEPGPQTIRGSVAIPSYSPSGHYTGEISATDQNSKELLCIKLDFHL